MQLPGGTTVSEMRRLWIESSAGKIEAMLRLASPARGTAVVAHPHPMYGGTMHNPVVFHVERELNDNGWSTLRFNFRGVGKSDGIHDEGRGEVDDIAATISWMRGLAPDLPTILVGYSFGAWCGYRHLLHLQDVDAFVAIGLPVKKYDFSGIARLGIPLAVVQGDHDEFGDLHEIRDLLQRAKPKGKLYVVPGATHLFLRRSGDVAARAQEAVDEIGRAPFRPVLHQSAG
jgi:alpha/beta superfamily hydrolase